MNLSVTVIAKNAAGTISRCLQSAQLVSNDIVVVVDTTSTDDTAEICHKFTSRVYFHEFKNFSDQKNYAAQKTKKDWILSLDADEWLSESLVQEIIKLSQESDFSSFVTPRKNIIFQKTIHHTNWDPNGIVRLYHQKHASWQGAVHEQVVATGSTGSLMSPIMHQNYTSVSQFIQKQDQYSSLAAQKLHSEGVRFNLFRFIFDPLYEFFRRFIWHAGFLDGWHGLFLSFLMGLYREWVWIKLWQKSIKNIL